MTRSGSPPASCEPSAELARSKREDTEPIVQVGAVKGEDFEGKG
jgi:hypothetical protein